MVPLATLATARPTAWAKACWEEWAGRGQLLVPLATLATARQTAWAWAWACREGQTSCSWQGHRSSTESPATRRRPRSPPCLACQSRGMPTSRSKRSPARTPRSPVAPVVSSAQTSLPQARATEPRWAWRKARPLVMVTCCTPDTLPPTCAGKCWRGGRKCRSRCTAPPMRPSSSSGVDGCPPGRPRTLGTRRRLVTTRARQMMALRLPWAKARARAKA